MIVRPSGLLVADRRLLVMRYDYSGHTRFNLPGGNREIGEAVRTGLIREFSEELDLEAVPGDLAFTVENTAKGRETLHLVFRIDSVQGTPCLNPDHTKALEVVWLDPDALEQVQLYPAIGSFLGPWLRGVYTGPIHLGRVAQPWFD